MPSQDFVRYGGLHPGLTSFIPTGWGTLAVVVGRAQGCGYSAWKTTSKRSRLAVVKMMS